MKDYSQAMGSGGSCLCPACGFKKVHLNGIPCRDEKCPECGKRLVREGSYHHSLFENKKKKRTDLE